MNISNVIVKLIPIYFLFFFISCSDSDTSVSEIPNDLETELQFVKITQNVTLNICGDIFCSIRQLTFLEENIGYAVSGVHLYKTNNGGEDWAIVINQDIVGRHIPLTESLMFLNTYDGILNTTNEGDTWSVIDRPLEFICQETSSINPGTILFVDDSNGFIQDKCYKGHLYRTTDLGNSWEQIYNSVDDIKEFYFQNSNSGFIIVNDIIYITENGGIDWVENENLPSSFDYVIEKEDFFLFPEGTPNVNKPEIINENISVTNFNVNANGDIAIILFDESVEANNWQLMLYLNSDIPEWIFVDQLNDLEDALSTYSSIFLTSEKTMYIGISRSGDILKYFVE